MNIVIGNILKETRGILVHSCNAQGVMGAGLAYQIKKKYPAVFNDYLKLIGTTYPDNLLGSSVVTSVSDELHIVSGIGQMYYGKDPFTRYTSYPAIRQIFERVNGLAFRLKLPVIFPEIGCGLGNGNWGVIAEIIEYTLDTSIERTLFKLK